MQNTGTWLKHINYQKSNKIISNGLTLPYLIGIYKHLSIEAGTTNAVDFLFKEILHTNTAYNIIIQRCPEIQQYVLGIEQKSFCNVYFKNEIRFKLNESTAEIIITQNAKCLGDNLQIVIADLNKLYKNEIDNNLNSWNAQNKKWTKFSSEEKKLIEMVQSLT